MAALLMMVIDFVESRREADLSVGDGNSLQFVSLLEGIRVWRFFGSVDQLVSQALSNGLDVTEGRLTSTSTQEPDGLIDTSQWRNVDSLTSDGTSTTDTSRIFSWAAVLDGID